MTSQYSGRASPDGLATLDILAVHLSAAIDVGADRSTRHRAARGRDVAAAPAANLVTEHPADDGADDRARQFGPSGDDLLPFDPAALLRCHDDRAHRRHRHRVVSGWRRCVGVLRNGAGMGAITVAGRRLL